MTSSGSAGPINPVVITSQDLVFYCPHCQGELVVDREGIGLEVNCPHCRRALTVPDEKTIAAAAAESLTTTQTAPALAPAAVAIPETAPAPVPHFDFGGHSLEQIVQRTGELKHQLKENQSQDMEMRGHINRATIELHRLQLKLKKLQARKLIIDAELAALQKAAPAVS